MKLKKLIIEAQYDPKEVSKMIDAAFAKLYDGINELDVILPNYFKKVGQGGITTAWRKQYVNKLKDLIEKVDNDLEKYYRK